MTCDSLQLFSYTSGNPLLGATTYFCGRWSQFDWPFNVRNSPLIRNLAFLELVPVVLALWMWVKQLKNKRLIFHIDNMALVSILNKSTSKDKSIMKLIRPFVLIAMLNTILFKAIYIESSRNDIADALSRFQMNRFRSLAPEADSLPSKIPEEFWEILNQSCM